MRENTLGDGGGGLEADKGRVRGDQLNLLYICPSRRLDTEVITVWPRLGVRERERGRGETPG